MSINNAVPGEIGLFNTMIASGPVVVQKRDGVEKILLVKHGDKPLAELKWKFPGGKVVKDSTLEENAIREAKEEIGVAVTLGAPLLPLLLWNQVPETGHERPQAIMLVHYLATITEEPVQGKEVLAMQWFALDALPLDRSPNIAPVIEAYLKRSSS